jgi:hypothetical protein
MRRTDSECSNTDCCGRHERQLKLAGRLDKTVQREASLFVLLTKYYKDDQLEDEMGGACSMHVKEEKRVKGFGGETRRKATSWKT